MKLKNMAFYSPSPLSSPGSGNWIFPDSSLVKGKGSPQGQGPGPAGSPRLYIVMPVVINNDNKYYTS